MSTQAVTLQPLLPIYEFFKSRAERAHRSVEGELLELVATVAKDQDALPRDLAEAVAGLEVLADEAAPDSDERGLSSP